MVLQVLAALEALVVDEQADLYPRAFAWYGLFRHWSSLRWDDTQALFPDSLDRRARGVVGKLERTKARGQGKCQLAAARARLGPGVPLHPLAGRRAGALAGRSALLPGCEVNPGIRVLDQVKYPTSAEGKVILSECTEEGGPHFSVHIDFSGAHRQVGALREDWGRQACQVNGTAAEASQTALRASAEVDRKDFETHRAGAKLKPRARPRIEDLPQSVLDGTVWLNKVGTFGVASAGYWWGHAGACILRLVHYLLGYDMPLWALLYLDDGWFVGRSERYEYDLLMALYILILVKAALAWHKVKGGIETQWIGYALDIGRFAIGISEAGTQWVLRWLDDKVRERSVRLGEFREGLGRLQFSAGPLEHARPFLGPL